MERKSALTREELMGPDWDGAGYGQEYASLPIPPMLMFDRVTLVSKDGGKHGKGTVVAELDVNPDLWFFKCHFVGDPVMPGCLGLDALWQMLGFYLAWLGHKGKGRALAVKEVKFRGEIGPQSKLVRYTLDIKRVIAGRLVMGISDGTVEVDGKLVYSAEGIKVGLFDPAKRQQGLDACAE